MERLMEKWRVMEKLRKRLTWTIDAAVAGEKRVRVQAQQMITDNSA